MGNYVWYATYGSNYYFERFKLYIQGGKIPSIPKIHEGSGNHKLPVEDRLITIPYRAYFSQKVKFWENQGVAFLDSTLNSGTSFSRIYKIEKEQFIDVFAQENSVSPSSFDEKLDWTIKEGQSADIGDPLDLQWYGKFMRLQDVDSIPVYTFTTKSSSFNQDQTKPGKNYLSIIIAGLKQKKVSKEEIINYLLGMDPLGLDDIDLINQALELSKALE